MYRDSVEIDELKHPFRVEALGLVTDSAGAGRHRGAPAQQLTYTALENPVQVVIPCDGQFAPPRGVNGGHNGTPGSTHLINHNGRRDQAAERRQHAPAEGPVHSRPRLRAAAATAIRSRATRRACSTTCWRAGNRSSKARDIYGVVFTGRIEDDSLAVDAAATKARRAELATAAK